MGVVEKKCFSRVIERKTFLKISKYVSNKKAENWLIFVGGYKIPKNDFSLQIFIRSAYIGIVHLHTSYGGEAIVCI